MVQALVPLAQGCEELEAVTIIDLLVRAKIDVVTASLDANRLICCSRGVVIQAQMELEQALKQSYDLVVLPGGLPGADCLAEDSRVLSLLRRSVEQGHLVAAICAAPKVLKKAGLLDGLDATSYPGVLDQSPAKGMRYSNQAVVDAGSVITSRGPGTAMDFALHLIERLKGVAVRQEVESSLVR